MAKMITLHEYPLHIVEHHGFVSFVQSLQPRFMMMSANDTKREILFVYQKEKQSLMQTLGNLPGRISLTISLWNTCQTPRYVCLSRQFIDYEWRLHRRMLNFMMVSFPHSKSALSEAIKICLSNWNMQTTLFTITLDNNCSSHDMYSANLKDHLANKNTLMLKGQLFVVHCYSHILNVIAQDVMASIHGIFYDIRESVKFFQESPACEEKFAEIALQLEIFSTNNLCLDVASRWNTTYLMLVAAKDYKQAFTCLENCNDSYNEAPCTDDWKKVEIVCSFLKLFYDSANDVMSTKDPTANIFFQEAWKILVKLITTTRNEHDTVSSIAKEMTKKFDKYLED